MGATGRMHVFHANWSGDKLKVWAESADLWAQHAKGSGADARAHPFATGTDELRAALGQAVGEAGEFDLVLPEIDGAPGPSVRMAHAVGHAAAESAVLTKPSLRIFRVPAMCLSGSEAASFLDALEDRFGTRPDDGGEVLLGPTVEFLIVASRMARHLVAQQRFVPALRQQSSGDLHGLWQPWVGDEKTAQRIAILLASMPPAARAAIDEFDHKPWPMLESFLCAIVDAE
jgi:hypothetical protein